MAALSAIVACEAAGEPASPPGRAVPRSQPGDASTADAMTDAANDATRDADGNASCPRSFSGCTTFVDATSPSASRVILYRDFEYAPKCLTVKAGQTVTFQNADQPPTDFAFHPLTTACGPSAVLTKNTGVDATFTMSVPGVYDYYCLDHGSDDGRGAMSAVLEVLP